MNNKSYLSFTAAFPVDIAKRIFEKKFGNLPKETFIKNRMLWVGPEPNTIITKAANDKMSAKKIDAIK